MLIPGLSSKPTYEILAIICLIFEGPLKTYPFLTANDIAQISKWYFQGNYINKKCQKISTKYRKTLRFAIKCLDNFPAVDQKIKLNLSGSEAVY